eukprot:1152680-Pelagomonas_calceolata.AAC.1
MARLVEGMGSIDSHTHTQEDRVESGLSTLNFSCIVHCVVAVRLLAGYQALVIEYGGFEKNLSRKIGVVAGLLSRPSVWRLVAGPDIHYG